MVDLSNISGLSIFLDWQHQQLRFTDKILIETTKQRIVREMRDVLLDQPSISDSTTLYVMYDGVSKKNGSPSGSSVRLRYDLTLIFPGQLGREFIKTAGHYHSLSHDNIHSYPELYEVLYGTLHFILQKRGGGNERIEDAVLVSSERGEKIIVPPDYGHVAVNPGNDPLVLANWIADECTSDYKTILEYGGGVYFEKKSNGSYRLMKNRNYKNIPTLRMIKTDIGRASIFDFQDIPSLYNILFEKPNTLNWLLNPKDTMGMFKTYIQ